MKKYAGGEKVSCEFLKVWPRVVTSDGAASGRTCDFYGSLKSSTAAQSVRDFNIRKNSEGCFYNHAKHFSNEINFRPGAELLSRNDQPFKAMPKAQKSKDIKASKLRSEALPGTLGA